MNECDNSIEQLDKLTLDIEKAFDDKSQEGQLRFTILRQVQNVIDPERHKEKVATYAFNRLKESRNLHLVVEYLNCRDDCYNTPEYEKFRKFREDLWARAKAEC